MPRRHKNARRRIYRPLRLGPRVKVTIYRRPKKKKNDIYPGRVVAVAEWENSDLRVGGTG